MPKPRTAEVVVYTGDYLDRIRHLERRHDAAEDAYKDAVESEEKNRMPPGRIGSLPASTALAEKVSSIADEHDALVAEAERTATRIRVTTVRRKTYRDLSDAHPPRDGDKGDVALGVNALTFREVLVPAAIVEVTEDGKTRPWSEYPDDEREEFLDTLAESDMERLFSTAYGLVNGFTVDPKMLASHSSQQTPENDET